MKLWVGITDSAWFLQHARERPDEVNFWQPGATPPTKQLVPGDLFLFKLHAPDNYIVGGGFFVRFTRLPARLAWEAFGLKNGVASLSELVKRVQKYRKREVQGDPAIGCSILNAPFFFPRSDWISIPEDWKSNIVRGKTYDTAQATGASLFEAVQTAMHQQVAEGVAPEQPRFGELYLAKARLGQGTFRILVTDAYHRRCAVTGEKTLPALEAAHVRPHAEQGPNRVNNGLLLRADIHRLFDSGLVTIDPDLRFIVSPRVREEYQNGREYYALHGKELGHLPENALDRPAREYLDWHNTNRFIG